MCELQRIAGFQKAIKGGIAFNNKCTLFYLAGQTGIFHNLKENSQKFFPISEKNEFTAMAMGAKNLLALASKGQTPKLIIYNLKTAEKYILPNPENFNRTEYVYVSFSEDNEYLAAQGGFPSWPFFMWYLEKRSFLGMLLPFRLELGTKVFKFAFDPKDSTKIVAIGQQFLRIYQHKNKQRFKEYAFHEYERSKKIFHSLTWIQKTNKFAIGTSDGIILIFEGKQLLQQVFLEKKLAEIPRILLKIRNQEDRNITCILSTKKGFICTYGGNSVLCLHWKFDKKDFNIVASVHIPKRVECAIEDSKIVHLALNSSGDMLAASTDDGQLLNFFFAMPGLLENIGYEAKFDSILDQQHRTPLIWADTAVNTPVHVTCSRSTVILWNYQKRHLLLWKKFKDEICSASVHPLGINLLVGFTDGCKMYNILYNKLEEIQHFKTNNNSQIKFSEGGHTIAIANANSIELYSSLTFEKFAEFVDHRSEITSMLWREKDTRLLSLDGIGNIYEWDFETKENVWYFTNAVAFSTLTVFNDSIYAATFDSKLYLFQNYKKTAEICTQIRITSLLATDCMLLAGNKSGMVLGYLLPLSENILFETCCHQGAIVNMTIKENGKLLLVTGEDGCISMWKMDRQTKTSIPVFDEVLIEEDVYESNENMISQLEKELKRKTTDYEEKRVQQIKMQEEEIAMMQTHYEDIQNQLKQKIIELTEETHSFQINAEMNRLDNIVALCKERNENYADFQSKFEKEEENFRKLTEERTKKIEEYEQQIFNLKEEIEASTERAKAERVKNESRLKELEYLLQKERGDRQEAIKQEKVLYRELEEKEKAISDEINLKLASELEEITEHNHFLTSEVDRISTMLKFEKECSRTLDAEFVKKKLMYDSLKKTEDQMCYRISQINNDIQRREKVIEEKATMIKLLEEDKKEIEHMSSEANWKHEERKKQFEEESETLSKLLNDLKKMKKEQRRLALMLKTRQREQFELDEKLKATEKSVADSNQKLLKAKLMLVSYRKEFIDATKNIDSPVALRWAMLQLLDKRILRRRVKEEEFFAGDTDPFMKFCRERDHYESLINTVQNRTEDIQASFRSSYAKLAKENSDWTAFAEALQNDLNQKKEKIKILEDVAKLPAKEFAKDPSETQKRFNGAYENLKQIEKEHNEEIQKRMDLIELQTKELQRLHGLLVVEERGKIERKIGH